METSTKVSLSIVAVIGLVVFWGWTTGGAYEEGYDDCKAGRRRGAARTQGMPRKNGRLGSVGPKSAAANRAAIKADKHLAAAQNELSELLTVHTRMEAPRTYEAANQAWDRTEKARWALYHRPQTYSGTR